MNTAYKVNDFLIDYTPNNHIGNLEWFNIASCARERMKENIGNSTRWQNERKSFYTALNLMVVFKGEDVKCEG
jgi:hypothetical protein